MCETAFERLRQVKKQKGNRMQSKNDLNTSGCLNELSSDETGLRPRECYRTFFLRQCGLHWHDS